MNQTERLVVHRKEISLENQNNHQTTKLPSLEEIDIDENSIFSGTKEESVVNDHQLIIGIPNPVDSCESVQKKQIISLNDSKLKELKQNNDIDVSHNTIQNSIQNDIQINSQINIQNKSNNSQNNLPSNSQNNLPNNSQNNLPNNSQIMPTNNYPINGMPSFDSLPLPNGMIPLPPPNGMMPPPPFLFPPYLPIPPPYMNPNTPYSIPLPPIITNTSTSETHNILSSTTGIINSQTNQHSSENNIHSSDTIQIDSTNSKDINNNTKNNQGISPSTTINEQQSNTPITSNPQRSNRRMKVIPPFIPDFSYINPNFRAQDIQPFQGKIDMHSIESLNDAMFKDRFIKPSFLEDPWKNIM
ncbi:hypothetical protein WA158_004919 [Blastocystis sp. Blastoise]